MTSVQMIPDTLNNLSIHEARIPWDYTLNLALQPPTRDDSAEVHNSTPKQTVHSPPYFSNSPHKPFMQMLCIAYTLRSM
ncbi:hypothetical protein CEXT_107621 [Caerostris extrusa]|uniref:Uncharacterized protein n=1 Tax=Caerostris extrusa TaxID=172846 RepID=A0AAV4TL32_CAEEX|nr:hypothetical protein CEXT_107621 [Caerostris extrusa]